jgi:hypothetical protein
MGDLVKLVDAAGIAMDNADVAHWARCFIDQLAGMPTLNTLVLVAETQDGRVDVVSTGRAHDMARLVGVLTLAASRKASGSLDDLFGCETG